jgi:hypothetical protein
MTPHSSAQPPPHNTTSFLLSHQTYKMHSHNQKSNSQIFYLSLIKKVRNSLTTTLFSLFPTKKHTKLSHHPSLKILTSEKRSVMNCFISLSHTHTLTLTHFALGKLELEVPLRFVLALCSINFSLSEFTALICEASAARCFKL